MKLKQRFILYTIFIICISIVVGFICSNMLYTAFVKEQVNNRYVAITKEMAEQIERHEITIEATSNFLETMGKLGYQIALVKEDGTQYRFGEPFKEHILNEQMLTLFNGEHTYNGMKSFKRSFFMMSHFANDIENTVGTNVMIEDEQWALFLRSNNTSFFTEFHIIILGFIVAVLICSIVGILLLSRKLIRSISELTSATKEIANHNFDYPLMIEGRDEFGELAASFRMMQQKLANTDEARKKFINNVSHDFQSPLVNIQGYSELLDQEIVSDEGKKYNKIIQTEAKRLSNLTKQLLVLTSIDQGTYPVNKKMVRIDEQLHQVIRSMLWRIEEKSLEITIDLQPGTVYADRSLLMNAWENLIGNAIKYTQEYGEICVQCYEENAQVIVKIQDSGVGIEKEMIDKIFDRFYRVDKARDKEGMGLGLSIVQEVLSYHHASIEVESALNEGTTFTITFYKNEAEPIMPIDELQR